MAPISIYLILSALMFTTGVVGVLIRKNPIIMFMCIEMMLNAANLSFVAFARQHNQFDGQVFVFFLMAVAAAEVVVGLAIIVSIFRTRATTDADEASTPKG